MLVTTENAKTVKGEKLGYITGIHYGAPHTEAGGKSLCPHSTPGCRTGCLYTAGRAQVFPEIIQARLKRSRLALADESGFTDQLRTEFGQVMQRAIRAGYGFAGRPNGTTDKPEWTVQMWERYQTAIWYEYTKFPLATLRRIWGGDIRAHYTYSLSEHPKSLERAQEYLQAGFGVAVVARPSLKQSLLDAQPTLFRGLQPCTWIDGDEHDLRFLDPKGAAVLLKAKGAAKRDSTGFVWG